MIARIPGWSWEVRARGITLTPPEGRSAGSIRYRERVRPLRSISALLHDKPKDPAFQVAHIGAVEPLVTAEGEYAAVLDVAGTRNGSPVQRTLGWVFTDDWLSEIGGLAQRPDQFERIARCVRELVTGTRLMLGVRRRRFLYERPRGWHGYARLPGFATWFSPDYPRDPTSITVYPGIPAPPSEDVHFAMLGIGPPVAADVLGELAPRTTVETESLAGAAWELDIRDELGRRLARRVVMLRDRHYLYTAYLDAAFEHYASKSQLLDALVGTIQPLPTSGASIAPAGLFDHYL